jgi:alanyl-tRNA synthetase
MSRRLYYTDSYLRQMNSRVLASSDDGLRITLDQTVFYPTSGGQPHDLGTLNDIPVVAVEDDGDNITHILAAPLTGSAVEGEISWLRRYDHMQQHTGQHLLSAVFEDLWGIPTLSFQMSDESSTIELAAKEISSLQIEQALLRATELARANPPIVITSEDAGKAQGLRKASERTGTLRIIEIPGIDRSACGGTHVATLAEVLPIQIRETDKVRGNARIAFVCGNRAIARARIDFQTLSRAAKALGASIDNINKQVATLQQRLAESEKQKQRMEAEAATRAGTDLYASIKPDSDGIRRYLASEPEINENARTKAKAFVGQPKAVCLLHSADGILLVCSPDSGVNAGALLKQALSKFGARGGGSPNLAQGSLPDVAILDDLKVALGLTSAAT